MFCSRKQVALTKAEAEKDGVVVPLTLEDYIVKTKPGNVLNHNAISNEADKRILFSSCTTWTFFNLQSPIIWS